jgi:hypothetical protein
MRLTGEIEKSAATAKGAKGSSPDRRAGGGLILRTVELSN